MIAQATSIYFVFVEFRCDFEGAIGSLTYALPSSGIIVSIAGPGQRVTVAERMARTLEVNYISYELVLLFVTTHTLIMWCVMFCMYSVNLLANVFSANKVSP
jgi:hypothetical protein